MAAAALPLLPANALATEKRTFSYGRNELDWYPSCVSRSKSPILVYVHGGAWALGNRRQVGAKADYFTALGYHFASVSYTLFPAADVQMQALQIAQAVNWIHHNSNRLSGDAERIALMGHSAGFHLSSLATLAGAIPSVKAMVCNDSRAYDLPFLAAMHGGKIPVLYKAPFTRKNMWAAWSPISYTGLQPPLFWLPGPMEKAAREFRIVLRTRWKGMAFRCPGSMVPNFTIISRSIGSWVAEEIHLQPSPSHFLIFICKTKTTITIDFIDISEYKFLIKYIRISKHASTQIGPCCRP